MAKKLGRACKLYRCATLLDGDTSTPALATWVEIDAVKDVSRGGTAEEWDATTRASGQYKQTLVTHKDPQLQFTMTYDPDDTNLDAIRTAWVNGSEIALAVLDGDEDVAGSQGLASNFVITDFPEDQALDAGVTVQVTAKPSSYTEWYEVSGS